MNGTWDPHEGDQKQSILVAKSERTRSFERREENIKMNLTEIPSEGGD